MKYLVFVFVLFLPNSLLANSKVKANKCLVPGMTLQWQLDHCLIGQPSDDEEYVTVKACMDLFPKWITSEDCDQNKKFKIYRCRYLLDRNLAGDFLFQGTLNECLLSKETVGVTVRSSGVGG